MHELAENRSAALAACEKDAAPALSLLAAPLTAGTSSDGVPPTPHRPEKSASASASRKQPTGLSIVCGAEFCERFASCALLSILVLYLTEQLGLSSAMAVRGVGMLNALGYLAALAGGGLVGSVLAAVRGATLGALLLAAGFSLLAAKRSPVLLVAMAFLIVGSGLFRPSVTMLLDQLYSRNDERRDAGHVWFWVAVNAGGALAPLAAGSLRDAAGMRAAFTAATLSILLCAAVLVSGERHLRTTAQPHEDENQRDAPDDPDALSDGSQRLWLIVAIGVSLLLYTVAYGQVDGALLLWARDQMDRVILGHEVPAAWFSSVPAVFVLTLGPPLIATMRKLRLWRRAPSPFG